MQIVCCQISKSIDDKAATFARITELLTASPPPGAALVVLPETFATLGSPDMAAIAADDDSASEAFLTETAKRMGVYMVGGVVSRGNNKAGRNELVVVDPTGTQIARYCKIHPFSYHGEDEHFEPGDETVLFQWHDFAVAPFVCYDLRFPEIFRAMARRGTQLFIVIANWPTERVEHWMTLLLARAIENQAYVVGVNRCGADPQREYPGRSLIIDPRGNVLADAGTNENIISAEVNLQGLLDYRKSFPALQDMRDPTQLK